MSGQRRSETTTTKDADSDGRTAAETAEACSPSETGTNDEDDRMDRSHLDDVADGSGCTEIWERLSEQRADAEHE